MDKDIFGYMKLDRMDILCGFKHIPEIFPCKICKKIDCKGIKKCKGYGSYRLGIRSDL
jgi:hypothetical protein